MRFVLVVLFVTLSMSAMADDSDYLKRAIDVLQVQRNEALDRLVISEAKSRGLNEALKKLQEELKALKDKYEPEAPQKKE